jgi:hypothetical protein
MSKTHRFSFDTIPSDMLVMYSPGRSEKANKRISNNLPTNSIPQLRDTNVFHYLNVLDILLKKTTQEVNKILRSSALDEHLSRDLFLLMDTFKKVYYILFTMCSKGMVYTCLLVS